MTRKWNIVNNNSKSNYGAENEIIYITDALKSKFCNYNDAYILERGNITIIEHRATQIAFKNRI